MDDDEHWQIVSVEFLFMRVGKALRIALMSGRNRDFSYRVVAVLPWSSINCSMCEK